MKILPKLCNLPFTRTLAIGFLICMTVGLSSCELFQQSSKTQTKDKPDTDTTRSKEKTEREREIIDTVSVKKEVKKDTLDNIYPHEFKNTYNVAYILPFYLDLKNPDKHIRKKKIANISKQFYMGSQLALDTLKSCGKNLNVHIFDTKNDSARVENIRKRLEGKDLDLIFGPLFTENVKIISQFSANKKVNMIAPLAHVKSCMRTNPYYISVVPGKNVIAQNAANLINQHFTDHNVYVVRQYDKTERQITWQMDSLIDTSSLRSYNKLALSKDNWKTQTIFSDTLKAKDNVIFIPSQSEVFTTSILSGIKAIDTINLDDVIEEEISVIGLPDWREFGSLNGKTMEKFSVHLLADYFVDYDNALTRQFVLDYRRENHNEPSQYAIKGYDFTLLAGKMMVRYGKFFQRSWYDLKTDGIHTNFNFNQVKGKRGWQNFYMETVKFEDYELKKKNY